jgi:hypothetical protein
MINNEYRKPVDDLEAHYLRLFNDWWLGRVKTQESLGKHLVDIGKLYKKLMEDAGQELPVVSEVVKGMINVSFAPHLRQHLWSLYSRDLPVPLQEARIVRNLSERELQDLSDALAIFALHAELPHPVCANKASELPRREKESLEKAFETHVKGLQAKYPHLQGVLEYLASSQGTQPAPRKIYRYLGLCMSLNLRLGIFPQI